MPIADGPSGTFTDYPFLGDAAQFLILRGLTADSPGAFVIRPSPKPCAVAQARGPQGGEGDAPLEYSSRRSARSHINRRCQWTGSLGIASCIRLRRSQGPDRDRWLSSFLLRVSRPTPPSRDRLISSVRRYIPSEIGLPSRSQIHLPLDSSPDPYLVRAAAYRKFAQCQFD